MAADYVYAYGNGQYLFYIFDGIARVLKPSNVSSIIQTLSLVGLTFFMGRTVFNGQEAGANIITALFKWLSGFTIITSLLMNTSGSIVIRDVVTRIERKVDNLPIGFSMPVSILSSFGYALTTEMEKNFTPVDYLPYHEYGLLFGSQLVAEARNLKIDKSTFWINMDEFITGCVMFDAMNGYKYTLEELAESPDIWGLIRDNAGTMFSMNYITGPADGGRSSKRLVTCREGARLLDGQWQPVYNDSFKQLGVSILGISKKHTPGVNTNANAAMNNILSNDIKSGVSFLGGGQSATEFLRQNMMIKSITKGFSTAKASKAEVSMMTSMIENGNMARHVLPILKGVIEAIVYSAFIFVFFMLVLPNGWTIFFRYIGIIYWLQLWAPLYAVLNLMMSLFANELTSGEFESGINIANIRSVASIHQNTAAISGYLSMSIPFIAKAIVDYSGHGMVQLAGAVTGASSAAASSVASEVTSGNISMDNRNIDNLQYATNNILHSDYSASFRGSSSEWQLADGMIERTQADGSYITMSGEGMTASTGHTKIDEAEMFSGSWQRSAEQHAATVDSLRKSYADQRQFTNTQTVSAVSDMAQNMSESEQKKWDETSSAHRSVGDAMRYAKILQNKYGYTKLQASELAINAGLSTAGIPFSALGINIERSVVENASQEIAESQDLSKEKSINFSREDLDSVLKSKEFTTNKHVSESLREDISDSFQIMQQQTEDISKNVESGDRYTDALTNLRSGSVSYSHDGYAGMQAWLTTKKGIDPYKAARIIDANGLDFKGYFKEYADYRASNNAPMAIGQTTKGNHINLGALEYAKTNNAGIQIISELAKSKAMQKNGYLKDQKFENEQMIDERSSAVKINNNNKLNETEDVLKHMDISRQKDIDEADKNKNVESIIFGSKKKEDTVFRSD